MNQYEGTGAEEKDVKISLASQVYNGRILDYDAQRRIALNIDNLPDERRFALMKMSQISQELQMDCPLGEKHVGLIHEQRALQSVALALGEPRE